MAERSNAPFQIDQLLEVLEVSRSLAGKQELLPLLQVIQRSALHVLDCERASVFLHDASSDQLVSRTATELPELRFAADLGLAGQVFRSGKLLNIPDAYADSRFNPEIDRQTGYRTRNLLTCPLLDWNNLPIGVLQVLNKRGGCFDAWDEVIVRTFGAQVGVALQRQILLDEFALKQRYQRDLQIAKQIQCDLLPRQAPELAGFEIAGWNQPADETGGDFFDFQPLPEQRLALALGDVTGHGIGPALVAAECRAFMRALAKHAPEPTELITATNQLLSEDLSEGRFVTVFFGLLHAEPARLQFLSAGHGPILFFDSARDEIRSLPPHGFPIGIVPDFRYQKQSELHFETGDVFLILTDGFVEWPDAESRRPGIEPVIELLREHHVRPAAEIIRLIYDAIRQLAHPSPQTDDLTAIVVKRL